VAAVRPARGEPLPLLWTWYLPLLAGSAPVLLLGFFYSALANRLAFAGWALAVAPLYTLALRQGIAAGWPALRLGGCLALLLGAGAGAFAALERAHHEDLDLGFRAVLPEHYFPAATSPRAAVAAALVLAAGGAMALASGLIHRRPR
jgi:hypothetical protein